MIRKVLIANRGEIACRIARTCRRLGIATVAVYAGDDRRALHARSADEVLEISSYLDISGLVAAARRAAADAIHPGYGFLAENADFAQACRDAGLLFIGPSPDTIRSVGSKTSAREVAIAAGVPVIPEAGREFPLLIKAVAGGGGRGMRVVRRPEDLPAAMESAQREAFHAFGDGALLLEKYIAGARHIEVQILGDGHGRLVHLGERECSIQRRHQKLIEESPSPAVEDGLRQRLGEAALAVARAIGYTNAGTVEFLLAPGGQFYFIEVNTRLQVEHPVTEAVTGLDLVEWQIRIAEGQDLSIQPEHRGHAVEARLYAEDPANGYAPSAGRLVEFAPSTDAARVDAGVERGDDVSVHYDGLLAKFVGWDLDRCSAIRRVAGALRRTDIAGITTNRDLLLRVLEHPQFQRGEATTAFLDEHPELRVTPPDPDGDLLAAAEVGYALLEEWSTTGVPAFFRNNPWRDAVINLDVEGRHVSLSWDPVGQMFRSAPRRPEALRRRVIRDGERYYVQGREVRRVPRFPDPQTLERRREEATTATLPGRVLKVLVTPGQQVHSGDPLVMLEAMKIEHTLRSHRDGVVEAVAVREGQMVAPGDVLVRVGDSL